MYRGLIMRGSQEPRWGRFSLVAPFFRSFVHHGTLRVAVANEPWWEFVGPETGPRVAIRFLDWRTLLGCTLNPDLRIGEAYMDGQLKLEAGTLEDFLHLARLNTATIESNPLQRMLGTLRQARARLRFTPGSSARRHVAHHYDLKDELFELFLDSDRQYSCAYFTSPDDDLEEAQRRKKLRLAAKLRLEPGQKVLDIGSGWGGLALHLAQLERIEVDGVTLSERQHAASMHRATQAGMADRVRFHLKDYRKVEGKYDRIVSVGMLEHVGAHQQRAYFKKVEDLLNDGGVAVIHCIGCFNDPKATNPWLEKYIFPGGFLPSLAVVFDAVERTRLFVTDVEILRLHYAETLKRWRERFYAQLARVRELYDERFIRMWDFYLTACEMVFRTGQAMVFQIQLSKSLETVPLTRDYIAKFEREAPFHVTPGSSAPSDCTRLPV